MKKNIDFEKIEEKYNDLINLSKEKMAKIEDYEHDLGHVEDVVFYIKKLMSCLKKKFDPEVCLLSAYWHDVGRTIKPENHEIRSAEMLKEELTKRNFDEEFIDKCYFAIKNHKYSMTPSTIEGKIVRDADKLAWIGLGRWESCVAHKQSLDNIANLLPKLRNEVLTFEESKKIYDEEIVKLCQFLYGKTQFTKKERK